MRHVINSVICSICAFLIHTSVVLAQQVPAAPTITNPPPQPAAQVLSTESALFEFFGTKTPYEFWLTCVILLAGLVFAGFALVFLKRFEKENFDSATRAVTIILVIIATMVLVTAGYNNEQIAPAFGLFGTIIGYILGRSDKRMAGEATTEAGVPPPPKTTGKKRGATG